MTAYFDDDGIVRIPCPTCGGPTEITASGALICRDHGSDHYRTADGRGAIDKAIAELEAAK